MQNPVKAKYREAKARFASWDVPVSIGELRRQAKVVAEHNRHVADARAT